MIKQQGILETPFSPCSMMPGEITLENDEVYVWLASLDLPDGQIDTLSGSLSPDELRRSEKYYFPRDRKRFKAGRGILRNILAGYLAAEPGQIIFSYNPRGKPFLSNTSNSRELSFNVSHACGAALYAVAVKRRVGVDLEFIQQELQWEEIAGRFFSFSEQAELWALPEKERRRAFFTFWTRKEAVLKAAGTGLTDEIREIDIGSRSLRSWPLSPGSSSRIMSGIWQLADLKPDPCFEAALAVEGEGMRIHCGQC